MMMMTDLTEGLDRRGVIRAMIPASSGVAVSKERKGKLKRRGEEMARSGDHLEGAWKSFLWLSSASLHYIISRFYVFDSLGGRIVV